MRSLKKSLALLVAFLMVFSALPVFADTTTSTTTTTATTTTAATTATTTTAATVGTPSDVVGTTYEDAVGKLVALKIISGYPDGSYKPDQSITRAEFAKVVCYIVGIQDAAKMAEGATKFKDVNGGWASGYINLASDPSRGLIKGYPDGTFKPDANVSYAEALTIMVRALGLGKIVEGNGTWPSNYLAKASEVGLTDGVTGLDGATNATRGNIAKMGWSTLTADKWGETKYTSTGVEYGKLDTTWLKDKYSDYTYKDANGKYVPKIFEDAQVVKTQLVGGLGTDEIQIQYSAIADTDHLNVTATTDTPRRAGDANNIIVKATGFNVADLLGRKVDVMFGKDNKVVNLKVKSSVAQAGIVDEFKPADNKFTIAGKQYVMAGTSSIYVNTELYASLTAAQTAIGSSKVKATAVLDSDGKVTTLDMFVADTNATLGVGNGTQQFIVKEVRSNKDVISLRTGSIVFNLDDITGVTSSKKAIIVKDGKTATAGDIKAGDAVTFIEVTAGSLYYVVDSSNKVTGKATVISPDGSYYKMTVNGTSYTMAKDVNTQMTKDANVDDKIAIDSSVSDYQDKDVTLTLNANGDILFVSATVTASASEQYGILTQAVWQSTSPDAAGKLNYFMEVRTTAGDKKAFAIKGDNYKTATTAGVPTSAATAWSINGSHVETVLTAGTLVQYKVDADGTVNAANLVRVANVEGGSAASPNVPALATKTNGAFGAVTAVNNDAKSIVVGGVTYYYTPADTTIYNANTNSTTPNKYLEKVDGWEAIANSTNNLFLVANAPAGVTAQPNVYVVYKTDSPIIKALIVDVTSYLTTTDKYGVVTSDMFFGPDSAGTTVSKIKIYVDGAEQTYTVANGVYNDTSVSNSTYTVKIGDVVKFTLNSDGKFDGGASDSAKSANVMVHKAKMLDSNNSSDYAQYVVKSISGNLISFNDDKNGATTHQAANVKSDVKVYDISGATPVMAGLTDVKVGSMVVEAGLDNGQYKYLIIVRK